MITTSGDNIIEVFVNESNIAAASTQILALAGEATVDTSTMRITSRLVEEGIMVTSKVSLPTLLSLIPLQITLHSHSSFYSSCCSCSCCSFFVLVLLVLILLLTHSKLHITTTTTKQSTLSGSSLVEVSIETRDKWGNISLARPSSMEYSVLVDMKRPIPFTVDNLVKGWTYLLLFLLLFLLLSVLILTSKRSLFPLVSRL
jgi:hypothetical protein